MLKEALAIHEFDHWFMFLLITVDMNTKEGTAVFEQHPRSNVHEPEAGGTWDIVVEKNRYIPSNKRSYRETQDTVSLFPPVFSDQLLSRLRTLRDAPLAIVAA